jgi:hypothetical protein
MHVLPFFASSLCFLSAALAQIEKHSEARQSGQQRQRAKCRRNDRKRIDQVNAAQFAFETGALFVPADSEFDSEPDNQERRHKDGRNRDGRIGLVV